MVCDRFYLGNLDVPVATVFSERQFDPELLPHAIDDLIQGLRQGETSPKGVVWSLPGATSTLPCGMRP